jgi:hypothetical protein
MREAGLFTMNANPDGDLVPFPTASIDFRTDVDAAAHLVARLLVTLNGVSLAEPVPLNTWAN